MVLGACFCYVALAICAAWPNPAIPDLLRHNATVYGTPMTFSDWQLDMLGSMVSVGNIPGTWLWGFLVAAIGRKRAIMLLVVPYTLGWCLVALAVNPAMLLAGRVVHGLCIGATFIAGSTYIIELPDTAVRGALAALPSLVLSTGFILTTGLGLVLRWYEIAIVGVGVIVVQTCVMSFLPESPSYLAISGREEEAMRVLRDLRGPSVDVGELLRILKESNKASAKEPLHKVMRNPAILKSLATVLTLFFVQNFCGLMVFYVNMTRIFLEAGSTLDESVATILVFLVQAVGTALACLYLDRFGRRTCLMFSLAVMSVCLLAMGAYHFLSGNDGRESYTWVPLVCLMVYMFASSSGTGPIPSILNSEYYPTAVRSQLSGLCMGVGSIINFAVLQLYSPLVSFLTNAGLFWFYAAVSVFGIVFTAVCVRETKGRAVG